MMPLTSSSNMAYNLKPGDILLAEKTRAFKLSNFIPLMIRLITGNKVVHVGIVETCNGSSITYRDSTPGGVKESNVINIKNESQNGLILANDTVVEKIARLTLPITDFSGSGGYNYYSIWTAIKYNFLRMFYACPIVSPDTHYGTEFNCSQYVAYLILKNGETMELFPYIDSPAMVEPDNFTAQPFEVIPIDELHFDS